jgi:4a-hydroxytetrahydrobiopterin dehydratase
MSELARKTCVACEGGVAPLSRAEAEVLRQQLEHWELSADAKSLSKTYAFKDFADALSFTNSVGRIAESEGHHPDVELGWGRVRIALTTHAIGGLSENDFIVAAKIDKLGHV